MKLNLRGKSRDFLTTIGKNINMILPMESNTSSSSDNYTSMWLSYINDVDQTNTNVKRK